MRVSRIALESEDGQQIDAEAGQAESEKLEHRGGEVGSARWCDCPLRAR